MSGQECEVPNCDGSRLGHDLAVDFPGETQRIVDVLDRMASPEDYVMPENLQVEDEA